MKPGEPVSVGYMLDGRYRVNRVIGQGGMGRVYLANDTRLANRPVAVKEMIVDTAEHVRKAIEDFQREASVLASLSHPGIPNLFDNFVEHGRHYLVMEFVAGGDLQGMLDKLGSGARVAEPKVLRWAHQILDVLAFLHAQKPPIIYRDFKPGNIMIDHNGRAMLIDFGIARFLPPGGRGTQIGSIGYAPPEQYMGKAEPRSDLYSLAATMHHLLTGRDPQLEPPFSFPPLRQLSPEVSLQTERVVMKALDKDIEKRPASAREMSDALPVPTETDIGTGETVPASLAGGPLAAVPTVVLAKPAPAAASAPPASAPSAISTMPTIVLAPPVDFHAAPAPATAEPRKHAKASGLKRLARIATPRVLKTPSVRGASSTPVSSTAKTQELKKTGEVSPIGAIARTASKPAAATKQPRSSTSSKAAPAAIPQRVGPGSRSSAATPRSLAPPPAPANSNGGSGAAASLDGARLISRTEQLEFAVDGPQIVIGRVASAGDGADIGIDLSPLKRGAERISRRHAEIVKLGRDYFIRDLGSLNGTYIAGRGRLGRDQLYKLKDRDEVLLGGAKLEFRKN